MKVATREMIGVMMRVKSNENSNRNDKHGWSIKGNKKVTRKKVTTKRKYII